jgi:hypothetical protein
MVTATFRQIRIIFGCVLLGMVVWHPPVHAQTSLPGTAQNVSIALNPANPGPNQKVVATLQSFGIDTSRSLVAWRINGKDATRGVGSRTLEITTGPVGTVTKIEAAVEGPNGIPIVVSRDIRPALVSILWEADTYTPPLYEGKALITPGAQFRLVALPELVTAAGVRVPATDLFYTWTRNGRNVPALSGYGKFAVTLINDTFVRPLSFGVTVSTLDKSIQAEGSVSIPIAQTIVHLIEYHPLLGMRVFEPIQSRFALSRDEVTLVAEPYYYSIASRDAPILEYIWKVGNTQPVTRDRLVFRRTGTQAGETGVELRTTHKGQLMQTNRVPFTVSFGARNNTTLPGTESSNEFEPPAF